MFRAIGTLIRAIWYAITFQFTALTDTLRTKPAVIEATYAKITEDHKAKVKKARDMIARMMKVKSDKEARLRVLVESQDKKNPGITMLKLVLAGALAKLQQRTKELQAQGMTTPEEMAKDAVWLTTRKAYKDFESTLKAKQDDAASLERDLQAADTEIAEYTAMLEGMARELEQIKAEGAATASDAIFNQQRKEIAEMKAGLTADNGSNERAKMQELRARLRSEADITEHLAGADASHATEAFLRVAAESESDHELDTLLGLATATEAPVAATPIPTARVDTKLPE